MKGGPKSSLRSFLHQALQLETVRTGQHVTIFVKMCHPNYLSKAEVSKDIDTLLTSIWRMGIASM